MMQANTLEILFETWFHAEFSLKECIDGTGTAVIKCIKLTKNFINVQIILQKSPFMLKYAQYWQFFYFIQLLTHENQKAITG